MGISAGTNIAIKVPAFRYDTTVAYYRDAVGLPVVDVQAESTVFAFGSMRLWLDCVPTATQPEVWLELTTDDVPASTERLVAAGGHVRDGIEPLGDVPGRWISDPAGTITLLAPPGA